MILHASQGVKFVTMDNNVTNALILSTLQNLTANVKIYLKFNKAIQFLISPKSIKFIIKIFFKN